MHVSAPVSQDFVAPVLFDTGTPPTEIEDSTISSTVTLAAGTMITVSLPSSAFSFDYTVGLNTNTATLLVENVNNGQNHIGVGYFESNYFYIDYSTSTEGWKLGDNEYREPRVGASQNASIKPSWRARRRAARAATRRE